MDEMYFGTMGWMRQQNIKSYFYGNACHVCKQYNRAMYQCQKCRTVKYCCIRHERGDKDEHELICYIIAQENGRRPHRRIVPLNTEDWKKKRENFMLRVQANLPRLLRPDEREMLLFPKSCVVCHKQSFIRSCGYCPSINFCPAHDTDDEHFDHSCEIFRLCLQLDMLSEPDLGYLRHLPVMIKYYNVDNGCLNFIQYCVEGYLNERGNSVLQAIHSQLITQPLTLLHAAKLINYDFNRDELCIHIIASNFTEENIVDTWEILFHSERMLRHINIIVIGRELQNLGPTNCTTLCPRCKYLLKTLTFSVHSCLYSTYLNYWSYLKPDLIIGYNPRIWIEKLIYQRGDQQRVGDHPSLRGFAWQPQVILALKSFECPVILTSYTKEEAIKDVEKINDVMGKQITCHIRAEANPYVSLRPYRDPETEMPIYQNSFLTIYLNIKQQCIQ